MMTIEEIETRILRLERTVSILIALKPIIEHLNLVAKKQVVMMDGLTESMAKVRELLEKD